MEKKILNRAKRLRRRLKEEVIKEGESGLCDFAILTETQENLYTSMPCHAAITRPCNSNPIAIVTLIRKPENIRIRGFVLKYLEWLMNHSVYSECFVTKSGMEAVLSGIILRTNIPANLLVAALIATRYPWEHSLTFYFYWCQLVKRGVDKSLAFLAAHCVKEPTEGFYRFDNTPTVHVSIDTLEIGRRGIKLFIKKDYSKCLLNPFYYRELNYRDVSKMFPGKLGFISLNEMTYPHTKRVRNPFGSYKVIGFKNKEIAFDTLAAILQEKFK